MDEEELEEYMCQVFGIERYEYEPNELLNQLRDEDGFRVDGCYSVIPAKVERWD